MTSAETEENHRTPAGAQAASDARRERGPGRLLAGAAAAVVVSLWMTSGAWGPRPPAGLDVMAHLVRAEFGLELLGRGRLDGWFPRFGVGHQLYLFYGPGYNWLLGLLRGLSLGALSLDGALKVAVLATHALLPLAVAFAARSLGLSRLGAGVAAVLSLSVSTVFGLGLQGLFGTGLLVHQLGAILLFLTLGSLVRVVEDGRARWTATAAASVAALLFTHQFSVLVLTLLLPILLLIRFAAAPRSIRALPRLALAVGFGVVLAAFWLVPFVAHFDLHGPGAGVTPKPLAHRLAAMLEGRAVFRPWVGPLVVAAWIPALVAAFRGWRPGLPLVLVPVVYVGAAHALYSVHPTEMTVGLVNRGLGYAAILATFPLAAAVAFVGDRLGGWIGATQALVPAVALVVLPLGPERALAREFPDAVPQMDAAARRLASVVPDGARFTVELDFPGEISRTGVVHPDTWLTRMSGRNALVVFNPVSSTSTAGFEGQRLGRRPLRESADLLARYGVSHVVTTSPELGTRLGNSSRFEDVWADPPVAIFELLAGRGQPPPASLLSPERPGVGARLVSTDPDRPRILFEAPTGTPAAVAIGWSPKWRARVDGRAIPVRRSDDDLLLVDLPPGRHRLDLEFGPDAWDAAGRSLSVAGLVAGAVLLAVRRSRW